MIILFCLIFFIPFNIFAKDFPDIFGCFCEGGIITGRLESEDKVITIDDKFFDLHMKDLPIIQKDTESKRVIWDIRNLFKTPCTVHSCPDYSVLIIIDDQIAGRIKSEIVKFVSASQYKTLEKLISELKKQLDDKFSIEIEKLEINKIEIAKKYNAKKVSISI